MQLNEADRQSTNYHGRYTSFLILFYMLYTSSYLCNRAETHSVSIKEHLKDKILVYSYNLKKKHYWPLSLPK